jgi:hypothetical protein
MAEKEKDGKGFEVKDRRTSSGEKEEPAQPPEPGEKPETETSGSFESGSSQETKDSGHQEVDFSTFIFSLFSSALIQMGDMADPITGQTEKNLLAAKQTIDILDILVQKTEGNLDDEEAKLLKNASAELKWKYLDTVKEKG